MEAQYNNIDVAALLAKVEELTIANRLLQRQLDEQHMLARIDAKTGLFNALHLKEATKAEFGRLGREQYESLAMLVIDLDHFKRVNDEHGHAVGDEVLVRVAAIIKEMVRENDIACRFGGEEMVVLMPDTSIDDATFAAERLREAIASAKHACGLTVTASIGVAACAKEHTPDVLFNAADGAVYKAKEEGRNCVRIHSA